MSEEQARRLTELVQLYSATHGHSDKRVKPICTECLVILLRDPPPLVEPLAS